MQAARTAWKDSQPGLDPAQLVFIDETGTTTNMTRARGRAARGKRLVSAVPHGHWKTTTFKPVLGPASGRTRGPACGTTASPPPSSSTGR